MDIEEISKIDFYLKSNNGKQNLLDSDSLIISDNDPNAVNKLKDAAYRLNEIKTETNEEIKQTWFNLFTKQIRYSVSRAKNKRKKTE